MIRNFRPSDTPVVAALLTTQFPAEERVVGMRPELVFRVVKRVYRWDTRLLIGLLGLFGKPVFRFLVADEGGKAVGTALLSFPGRSVYISTVATDPTVRRRGYARALLETTRTIAQRMHREFLVLDVLTDNTPARTLYEQRLGYVPLRETRTWARDHLGDFGPERTSLPEGIRPYLRSDERALVALARADTPAEVQRVLPRPSSGLAGGGMDARIFETKSAAWVLDRGRGPEAGIGVQRNPNMDAAYLAAPIVGAGADLAKVREMVRVAGSWAGARGATRVVSSVPIANQRASTVLAEEGFDARVSLWTLYRPTA